ncbi:hypothetical protein C8A00DRAFT_14319 [Chaetomidium leptoderma]|uniref:Uncharacterized protein n=1 Tax=Chaetomidium leptoderma TaxID=669021 RepID=A0AAN6ZZE1_9PEZI|nr:hypothetical protein C8A00DRAFT_14319 [Chaetomidium leptoderma]
MDTHSHLHPLFLSPALPSDLLQFVINRCAYPTTLIICCDRAEFLSSLTQDLIQQQAQPQQQPQPNTADEPHPTTDNHAQQQPQPQPQRAPSKRPHPFLTPLLSQLATTRHIRTVFVPTVSHLRAFLSVFSTTDSSSSSSSKRSKVPPPPPPPQPTSPTRAAETTETDPRGIKRPLLVVYNFLALHRHTSEWSVQGLGASAAGLVEVGAREWDVSGVGVVVVEQPLAISAASQGEEGEDGMKGLLRERVPVLSGSARRARGDLEATGWAGKTVDVGRVLGRWFRFRDGGWPVEGW